MSSIVTAVFKATIGLLVDKGRDKAAERLREGDVTEQQFRSVIVREIDDIKSKLDGLSRKDLLASISFFEEGIELLYKVFDEERSRRKGGEVPVQAACVEAFALAEEMRNVRLNDLDESATRALAKAKKRFEDARREATRAFKNEALTPSDRILAMEYRVMATILETIDNPADAIAPCKVCIKEINCLSTVKKSFNVELGKGVMARFNKEGRGKIIASVCHVNRVIFDVTQAIGKEEPFWMSRPTVDTEEKSIDPIREERLVQVLRKENLEHCFVAPWSFGQEGVEEHRLINPCGMAMNSKGQFIITESDGKVKVFDRRGQFVNYFSLPVHNVDLEVFDKVIGVALDMNDNFYVLVKLCKRNSPEFTFVVYMFSKNEELHHQFPVKRNEDWPHIVPPVIVNSKGKVVIKVMDFRVRWHALDIYENDGQFVRRFGGLLWNVMDVALAADDRVIVLDGNYCLHMFSEHGDHLSKSKPLCSFFLHSFRIAFYPPSEHVIVADLRFGYFNLGIYTKDCEFVHDTQTHVRAKLGFTAPSQLKGMILTAEGHVAVLGDNPGRVFILC